MPFSVRTIESALPPNLAIATTRDALGWTLEKASRETAIQPAYLRAIEEGRFADLPHEPMRTHLVRRYVRALGINPQLITFAHALDLGAALGALPTPVPMSRPHRLVLTPAHLKFIGLAAASCMLVAYLGIQVHNLISAPTLTIETPTEGLVTTVPTISVHGATESVATVTVNAQPVAKSADGSFVASVNLARGMNIITVGATKRYSHARTRYRTVMFEEPAASFGPTRPEPLPSKFAPTPSRTLTTP